jgi:thiamine biosynthesis lipoprotein
VSGLPAPLRFRALGTTAVVAVTESDARADAGALLRDELDAIDRACSRFRDDSEIAAVNAAAGRAVPVSPLFLEAIDVALRAAELTDGRVDPTVGSALRVLGYDRDFAEVAPTGAPLRVHVGPAPGWQSIRVDRTARTVRVPPGVSLDFGATAKALAADRAAHRIAYVTGAGVLVSLGGDCALAGSPPPGGWAIHVTDRHDDGPGAPGQTIRLVSGGLATSGTAARRWERGGRTLHHVVDPETGWPAPEVWRTVSVAAASCVDANIASTAGIVLGAAAPGWLQARRLPARLVRPDGGVVCLPGWPVAMTERAVGA